jgi:hypothetical protein
MMTVLLHPSCTVIACVLDACMQVLKMLGKDRDGEEGLSTGGNSRPVYIADATYVKHHACNSATSCMNEINSTR